MVFTISCSRSTGLAEAGASGAGIAAAISSLPMTYHRVSEDASADVVVVSGRGWAPEALRAARAGVPGVLVLDPTPADPSVLDALSSTSTRMILDSSWRHNPLVDQVADRFAAYDRPGALLEARLYVCPDTESGKACVGILDLVTAIFGPVCGLRSVMRRPGWLVLQCRLPGDAALLVSLIATDGLPQEASLRILDADGGARITIPDAATAAPALATFTGPAGHNLAPTRYESAHRGALKRLAALISGGRNGDDSYSELTNFETADLTRFWQYSQLLTAVPTDFHESIGAARAENAKL